MSTFKEPGPVDPATVDRIVIFGCRNVDPASVYSLMNGRRDIEIALFGEGAEMLRRDVAWLCAALPPRRHSRLRIGTANDLAAARIALISSGHEPRSGRPDNEHMRNNAELVAADAKALATAGFCGVLIVTTEPAEVMAHVALDASGLDERSVIGLGRGPMVTDEQTPRKFMPVAAWCTASHSAKGYIDSCQPDCPYFEDTLRQNRSLNAFDRSSTRSMASCVMRICEAVLTDEQTVLPVSAMMRGELGISGVFLTIPCIIGATGIKGIVSRSDAVRELQQLRETASLIRRVHRELSRKELAVAG
jgi:L-lactate dehydrogenase